MTLKLILIFYLLEKLVKLAYYHWKFIDVNSDFFNYVVACNQVKEYLKTFLTIKLKKQQIL